MNMVILFGGHIILQNIEKIQRRTTKMLTGSVIHDISYPDHLLILNLPSLKYRRLRGDMILVYCLLNNDVDIDFNDFFTTPTLTSTTGRSFEIV